MLRNPDFPSSSSESPNLETDSSELGRLSFNEIFLRTYAGSFSNSAIPSAFFNLEVNSIILEDLSWANFCCSSGEALLSYISSSMFTSSSSSSIWRTISSFSSFAFDVLVSSEEEEELLTESKSQENSG